MRPPLTAFHTDLRNMLVELLKDERGTTTLQYSAGGGVMAGMILWAFRTLNEAQTIALDNVLDQIA